MKIKYYFLVVAAFILMIQLSSCVDIDRKIKINANGSGNEKQVLHVDKMFYDMLISLVNAMDSTKSSGLRDSLYNHEDMIGKVREDYANKTGIKLNRIEGVTNSDSSSSYYLDYDFDKVEYIGKSTNINPENIEKGGENTEVKWVDTGNEIKFTLKNTNPVGDNPDDSKKDAGFLFNGKKMKISIEFPYDIKSTNAMLKEGRTAEWLFDMSELSSNPSALYLEAVLKK
jgi:hypothetical protein